METCRTPLPRGKHTIEGVAAGLPAYGSSYSRLLPGTSVPVVSCRFRPRLRRRDRAGFAPASLFRNTQRHIDPIETVEKSQLKAAQGASILLLSTVSKEGWVPRSFAVRRMALKTRRIRAIDPFRIEDPGTLSTIRRVGFVPNQELNHPESRFEIKSEQCTGSKSKQSHL